MVATTGEVLKLTALKEAIFPEPEAASPIEGALFVQLYVAVETFPLKLTAAVGPPVQTI